MLKRLDFELLPTYPFFVLKTSNSIQAPKFILSRETKIITAITMVLQNCRNNGNYGNELLFWLIFICGDDTVVTLIMNKISHLFALTFYYLFLISFQRKKIRPIVLCIYCVKERHFILRSEKYWVGVQRDIDTLRGRCFITLTSFASHLFLLGWLKLNLILLLNQLKLA